MRLFLFKINCLPKLDSPSDRKLICSSRSIKEEIYFIELMSPSEEQERYFNMKPGCVVGLNSRLEDGTLTKLQYFNLNSFEIIGNTGTIEEDNEVKVLNLLRLNVKRIN